jgi:type II secretory pathway component PulF
MLRSGGRAASAERSYRYRAARSDGTIEQGTVRAATAEAARAILDRRAQWIVELRSDPFPVGRRRGASSADLGLGLRLLASFLDSGLPMARALAALEDSAPPSWQSALPAIRESVQRGEQLGTALDDAPLAVPPAVIGMIRAGEAGSGLASAVRRGATHMESAAATRAAIGAALAYPIILSLAGAASVALLVGVVLPRFATILADLGQALPPTTQAVLTAAQLIQAAAPLAFVIVLAGAIVWQRWTTTDGGRTTWHTWLLTLPVVGPIRRASATARYAHALSALLESGVPIGVALRSAADAAGDAAVAARLLRARDRVVHGEPIAASLRAEDAGTPTVLRLVRAGEESGRLAELLSHAASLEQERVERTVKAAVRLLEPALILAFGGLVAFVAAALLQAVYSVRAGV